VLDNLEFPSYDMTFGSYPQNTVINVYSFNSAPVSAMIGVFKDEDNDNRVLYNELTLSASEPIYLKTKAISNSILLTNKFFMAKTVVNLSVNGNPAGYVNPKVIVSGSSIGIGSKGYAPVSQTITIHSELSNIGYQGIAFAFSDVNGDGKPTTQTGWGWEFQAAIPTTVTSATIYEHFTLLDEVLNKDLNPNEDRHVVLPFAGKTMLLQASELQPSGIEMLYTNTIVNGKIGSKFEHPQRVVDQVSRAYRTHLDRLL